MTTTDSEHKPITLRGATGNDVPAMSDLLEELFSIETDFRADPDKQQRGLRLLLEQPTTRLIVAELDGNVIGMCSVQTMISTAEGNTSGLIEDVVVRHEYRSRGIGRCLLDAAIAWAEQQGMARIQLLADQRNTPALQFYDRLGWEMTNMFCLRKRLTNL